MVRRVRGGGPSPRHRGGRVEGSPEAGGAARHHAEIELAAPVESCRKTAPKLADWREKNVPGGFAVFPLDEAHKRRMRTSNLIERAIRQEIKRRTRKVSAFPNDGALPRPVTAALAGIDDDPEATN